jgi:endonuclease YncB( thermonuclease family)
MRSLKILALALGLSAALPLAGSASETISGKAFVTRANVLMIEGRAVRLFAIEVLEPEQTCDNTLVVYPCGQVAMAKLAHAIVYQTVECAPVEEKHQDGPDDPVVSVCHVGDTDIGYWMVRIGFALADRNHPDVYGEAQAKAREVGNGIWAGPFVLPWDWRAGVRCAEQAQTC